MTETLLLVLGHDPDHLIRLQSLTLNGATWPTRETLDPMEAFLALRRHEFVIRTDEDGRACVYRRERQK